jgi:hypothetical protein
MSDEEAQEPTQETNAFRPLRSTLAHEIALVNPVTILMSRSPAAC